MSNREAAIRSVLDDELGAAINALRGEDFDVARMLLEEARRMVRSVEHRGDDEQT